MRGGNPEAGLDRIAADRVQFVMWSSGPRDERMEEMMGELVRIPTNERIAEDFAAGNPWLAECHAANAGKLMFGFEVFDPVKYPYCYKELGPNTYVYDPLLALPEGCMTRVEIPEPEPEVTDFFGVIFFDSDGSAYVESMDVGDLHDYLSAELGES